MNDKLTDQTKRTNQLNKWLTDQPTDRPTNQLIKQIYSIQLTNLSAN